MTTVVAKLAAVSALVTALWEQVDPLAGALVAFVTIAATAYRSIGRPVVRTVRKAGDVYDSLSTMDQRVSAQISQVSAELSELSGQVERLAGHTRRREGELDARVNELASRVGAAESMVEALRFIIGTRSSDHPPQPQ